MASTLKDLYERAMSLTDQDSVELVGLLLETLDIEQETGVEVAWLEEIERRVADLDSGTVKPVPWPEVRARVFDASASRG
jgi:putative addiction module component (TIGR02574 family)